MKTILLCFFGYFIYASIISRIFILIGYAAANNANMGLTIDLMFFVNLLIQLIGEEFFKIFLLLIVMYVIYKKTQNRSLSISVGVIVTLLVFGLAHDEVYSGRILQILLIQGLGTFFNLYAYMKTKNFVVSYIIHIMIDISSTLISTASHIS